MFQGQELHLSQSDTMFARASSIQRQGPFELGPFAKLALQGIELEDQDRLLVLAAGDILPKFVKRAISAIGSR